MDSGKAIRERRVEMSTAYEEYQATLGEYELLADKLVDFIMAAPRLIAVGCIADKSHECFIAWSESANEAIGAKLKELIEAKTGVIDERVNTKELG